MCGGLVMISSGLSCYVEICVVATWYVCLKMRVYGSGWERYWSGCYWFEWIGWSSLDSGGNHAALCLNNRRSHFPSKQNIRNLLVHANCYVLLNHEWCSVLLSGNGTKYDASCGKTITLSDCQSTWFQIANNISRRSNVMMLNSWSCGMGSIYFIFSLC